MNVWKVLGIVLVLGLVIGGGVWWYGPRSNRSTSVPKTVNDGIIQYQADDSLFTVTKTTTPVLDLYSASSMAAAAAECGNSLSEEYFTGVLSQFSQADMATAYHFKYKGDSQANDEFLVTVMPNKPQYTVQITFQDDFNQCSAGADRYPHQVSVSSLMFISSTGTGFDDGSGKPVGAELVRDAIEPTLMLVQ